MPIPLLQMQASSYDNPITMTNVSSNVCTTTIVTTILIVLVKPYVPLKPILDSGEPSRMRKGECSGSSSGVSCDEIWTGFQFFWASRSAGVFSSSSFSQLPRDPCSCSSADCSGLPLLFPV